MLNLNPRVAVIEPNTVLAETLRDIFLQEGYTVDISTTHIGAAHAAELHCPHLLVACVPACAQDRPGAYLAAWRDALGSLPTVLTMSERAPDRHAPAEAVCLFKPFTRAELLLAVDIAISAAARTC